jgi:hypothetical protein
MQRRAASRLHGARRDAARTPDRSESAVTDRFASLPVAIAQHHAASLSARYFLCPVYLVGGAVTDSDPRDVDLVIPIPDDLFKTMYGMFPGEKYEMEDASNPSKHWRRWARDCAKQSRVLTLACIRAVDFKTQSQTTFATYDGKPRVRLDCFGDHLPDAPTLGTS